MGNIAADRTPHDVALLCHMQAEMDRLHDPTFAFPTPDADWLDHHYRRVSA
jgi:hypothetical protein